jgi:hypothetical protein
MEDPGHQGYGFTKDDWRVLSTGATRLLARFLARLVLALAGALPILILWLGMGLKLYVLPAGLRIPLVAVGLVFCLAVWQPWVQRAVLRITPAWLWNKPERFRPQ